LRCDVSSAPSLAKSRNYAAKRIPNYVLVVLFTCAFCGLVSTAASAQSNNSQLRTVHGTVVDKNDNPAPTSIVFLLNSKTQAVRSYFADEKGEYHFTGLDPNVDYEIHAERGNMTSSTRTISSFDSRHDIDLTLKLAHQKPNGGNKAPASGEKTSSSS
jgi:Carboxypeptidase regulatory-like domain